MSARDKHLHTLPWHLPGDQTQLTLTELCPQHLIYPESAERDHAKHNTKHLQHELEESQLGKSKMQQYGPGRCHSKLKHSFVRHENATSITDQPLHG